MTNYTSLETGKRVYGAFGWKTGYSFYQTYGGPEKTPHGWTVIEGNYDEYPYRYDGHDGGAEMDIACPAYDSDYLLKKLQATGRFIELMTFNDGWIASFAETASSPDTAIEADTPSEALGLLALKLREEGLL